MNNDYDEDNAADVEDEDHLDMDKDQDEDRSSQKRQHLLRNKNKNKPNPQNKLNSSYKEDSNQKPTEQISPGSKNKKFHFKMGAK